MTEKIEEASILHFFERNAKLLDSIADEFESQLRTDSPRSLVSSAKNSVITALYNISDGISRFSQIIDDHLSSAQREVSQLDSETKTLFRKTLERNINLPRPSTPVVLPKVKDDRYIPNPPKLPQIRPYSFTPLNFSQNSCLSRSASVSTFCSDTQKTLPAGGTNTVKNMFRGSFSQPNFPEEGEKAFANFDYEAQREDELSLRRGDVVVVFFKNDDNWWFGANRTQRGFFPGNFVTSLK